MKVKATHQTIIFSIRFRMIERFKYMPSKKIANFLIAIDEKIEKVNEHITTTETYKKGLLQQMFI